MSKVTIVRIIVKLYFVGALAGSFTHIVHAASKVGLSGWEMWSTPLMIDGIAVIGMIMRSSEFSSKTRKIGFRTQLVMGTASLTANVFAGWGLIGPVIYGVGIVAVYLFSEWLGDKIETHKAELAASEAAEKATADAQAIAEAEHLARQEDARLATQAAAVASKKAAAIEKGRKTRERNKRIKAQQIKMVEQMTGMK